MPTVILSDTTNQGVILTEQIQGPSGSVVGIPTGTGFVHVTSGVVDIAARAVNLASNGANGDVTGVTNIANGGTGLSAVGTAGQLLGTDGTSILWVNPSAEAITSLTQDVLATGPGAAAATVVQARAGLIHFAATTAIINWAASAQAGLYQSAAASDVAPVGMSFTPQAPFPAATVNLQGASVTINGGLGATTNGLGGNVVVNFTGANTNTGVSNCFLVNLDGTTNFQVFGYDGGSTGLWLGPSNTYTSLQHANLYTDGGQLQINGYNGVIIEYAGNNRIDCSQPGNIIFTPDNVNVATMFGATNELDVASNLAVGTITGGAFSGGVGVISIANAGTTVSAGVLTGSIIDSEAGTLTFWAAAAAAGNNPPGGFLFNVGAPTGSGADARLVVARNGTASVAIGPYNNAGASYQAIYFGDGAVSPGGTNYSFLSNTAGSDVRLNAPDSGGAVSIWIGNAVTPATFSSTAIEFTVSSSTVELTSAAVAFNPAGTANTAYFNGGTGECSFGFNLTVGNLGGVGTSALGGAVGAIGLSQAATNPSTTTSVGVIYADNSTGTIGFIPVGGATPSLIMGYQSGAICLLEYGATPGNFATQYNLGIQPQGVPATGVAGGTLILRSQKGDGVSTNGGNIVLAPGASGGGTGTNGYLEFDNIITTNSASTGGATIPVTCAGFMEVILNNTPQKIPYF